MNSPRPQRTLADTAAVSGFGYWSSRDVRLELRPAPANSGVTFVRGDLPGAPRIAVDVSHRQDVPRRTNLAIGNTHVEMVEHVLAALAGLRIDNCEVWTDAPEMPGPDGSSWPIVEALLGAGAVEQDALRRQLVIEEPLRIEWDGAVVIAEPHDGYRLEYQLDYGEGPIGRQDFALELSADSFLAEIARARTFILQHEAEWLRERGLGLRATNQDLLVFGAAGPIDNELRFADECVRHKTLDLVGDLALAGCDLVGSFTAYRSGHKLNSEMVRQLLALEAARHPESSHA
ncbi:MAG: UDP-3-O-[3-hydroxymyristoyl] N-acetylglucosamine deacetylase [Planctomycetales bacterium]|nr:UDP-3-O-[3-hydroxymyristoyl] N-acetylglucosamine deacetylase [Planctomycetales bacterium]